MNENRPAFESSTPKSKPFFRASDSRPLNADASAFHRDAYSSVVTTPNVMGWRAARDELGASDLEGPTDGEGIREGHCPFPSQTAVNLSAPRRR